MKEYTNKLYIDRKDYSRYIKGLKEIVNKYNVIMSGYPLLILTPDIELEPFEKEVIKKFGIEVINSVIDNENDIVPLVRLLDYVNKLGLKYDINYNTKKVHILYSNEDEDKIIEVLTSPLFDIAKKYWNVTVYEVLGNNKNNFFYVPISKYSYLHKLFKPRTSKSYLMFFKHFLIFSNGRNIFNIDVGEEALNYPNFPRTDFLFLSHGHSDHSKPLVMKKFVDENFYEPYIHTNLPTLELIYVMKKSFEDIPEEYYQDILRRSYVNNTVLFDTIRSTSYLSGHAYGLNFYIENFEDGYTLFYFSDTNIYSKAFKSMFLNKIENLDIDILAMEYPQHTRIRTFIPKPRTIIGTTVGEYEELLVRLKSDKIMIDEKSTILMYDEIRNKYKSYLKKEVINKKVEIGSINDFINSDYEYFITTKGLARKYNGIPKYKKKVNTVALTNSVTEDTKLIQLKTHLSASETLKIIEIVKPKILVFHHFNVNTMNEFMVKVNKLLPDGQIFVMNDPNSILKLEV